MLQSKLEFWAVAVRVAPGCLSSGSTSANSALDSARGLGSLPVVITGPRAWGGMAGHFHISDPAWGPAWGPVPAEAFAALWEGPQATTHLPVDKAASQCPADAGVLVGFSLHS